MSSSPAFSLGSRLRAGEVVYTGWCGLPYPIVAEVVAREGFSAITLDGQHGLWDVAATVAGIAAVRQAGAAPIVRVPVGDFSSVSRALDFGAEGIIAPMINTVADARAFVSVAKFPPIGDRSWGPHRAAMLAGITNVNDYLGVANDAVVTFAMIETRTALANLDAIAATPGIDALFLGPSDLSITLSEGKTLDPLSKEVEAELDRIIAAARKAGKIPGAYCHNAERAVALSKRGMRFLAVSSDMAFLRAGAAAQVKVFKGA
jgi:4-hydroxy-2-oxoheptanedioate aldolase